MELDVNGLLTFDVVLLQIYGLPRVTIWQNCRRACRFEAGKAVVQPVAMCRWSGLRIFTAHRDGSQTLWQVPWWRFPFRFRAVAMVWDGFCLKVPHFENMLGKTTWKDMKRHISFTEGQVLFFFTSIFWMSDGHILLKQRNCGTIFQMLILGCECDLSLENEMIGSSFITFGNGKTNQKTWSNQTRIKCRCTYNNPNIG